ncbi:MAG: lysylphosphatidylglycerol synthase transmembrane domain-containing protein [Reichenbachiella sp.]|uniref:lysylphosphatidylglycerol synthase transmembrane domain-containing protein n=1 Tax=Reichenbachiella sp. TaxID=2184521 RepID=UPI0029674E92|nr:lysylphosphatidylglycerol synthase transmembrane domain-containing protein [Reichenbachiella sp.]MDW3211958.1 lysylphosphatidylglycerol synthase transmembrane domain-containing protein [Reichenbachiella sp.]
MDRKNGDRSGRLMEISKKNAFKVLNPNNIWVPILLGLGIVFLLFYFDDNITSDNLKLIFDAKWSSVFVAFLVLLARDAGYAYRIRTLTNQELTWKSSIVVIILWEFASAVTPSVVGGTAVAVFILTYEGINFGKSLAYVMLTAILDNLFFVVAAPIVMLLTKGVIFPSVETFDLQIGSSLQFFFFLSYGLIAVYTLVMSYGLFAKPRAFKWFLLKMTSMKWLKRWKVKANQYGDEIIIASSEIKGKMAQYWIKISLATIFIWCARYLMLNSLVSAYTEITIPEHMVIFSRQIIMWIVMLISPTPGSSGTAEFFFNQFFNEYLDSYTFVSSIFWRLMSYYPYLLLGAIFLPRWVRSKFFKK